MIFSPPHLNDSTRWAGMRVGLLGGSFNPPHEGHVHISMVALKSLKLDVIWWLVTPKNPLKRRPDLDFSQRMELCQNIITQPRLIVSDLERQLGTNLTWRTIRGIKQHFPRTDFVWVTGMDNALTMHTWQRWTDILDQVATAHVARPPAWDIIETCPLKMRESQNHVFLEKAAKVPLKPRSTYWLMTKRMLDISSTKIRDSKQKQ